MINDAHSSQNSLPEEATNSTESSSAISDPNAIVFYPIGVVHSPYQERYLAPLQAENDESAVFEIELNAQCNYETALRHLDGFSHIWVVWLFHEAQSWLPIIQTPRDGSKHGVFATRSPHRPNPVAISALRLLSIEGRILRVIGADMVDGTPVIDIKPYISRYDSIPDAVGGWADNPELHRQYTIQWSDRARRRFEAVDGALSYTLLQHVERRLLLNPLPTSSNRVEHRQDNHYTLASRAWRVDFHIEADVITIDTLRSAYSSTDRERITTELNESEAQAHIRLLDFDQSENDSEA